MKLIHISDIHIDSALADYPHEKASVRRNELLNSLSHALDYGKKAGAEICLITGDLFDGGRPSKTAREKVVAAFAASTLKIILLHGNHDAEAFKGYGFDSLPKNVVILNCGESVCINGLYIAAAPYIWTKENFTALLKTSVSHDAKIIAENSSEYSEKYQSDEKNLRENLFMCDVTSVFGKIIMAHGEIGETQGAVNPKWFDGEDISYLAMGHYHDYSKGSVGERGIWAYPGCLEGRGFDETGEKGLIEILLEGKKVAHRFVKMSKRVIRSEKVDVSGTANDEERIALIREKLSAFPKEDCIRFILCGYCENADAAYICERLSSQSFYLKIKNETSPLPSAAERNTLRGEFLDVVYGLECGEDVKALIIQYGLTVLSGEKLQ